MFHLFSAVYLFDVALQVLKNDTSGNIHYGRLEAVDKLLQSQHSDDKEFDMRLDEGSGTKLETIDQCYDEIKQSISGSPVAEKYFFSILQRLRCNLLSEADGRKTEYYKLIDECMSKIAIQLNQDSGPNEAIHIDVSPIIEDFAGQSKLRQENLRYKVKYELSKKRSMVLEETLKEVEAKINPPEQQKNDKTSEETLASQANPVLPPPPSALPPPPPPPPPTQVSDGDILTKLKLNRKQKYDASGISTKRVHWPTIPIKSLSSRSLWVNMHEERILKEVSPGLVEDIKHKFSKAVPVSLKVPDSATKNSEKIEIKVLDGKKAQNMSIALRSYARRKSYDDIRKYILQCDTQLLIEDFLECLIQNVKPDELEQLKQFGEYDKLCEAEQFLLAISDIKRLIPRLKLMRFKQKFDQNVESCQHDIDVVTLACKNLMTNEKFKKLLK